jgi:Spy/CpxP family protein refolding chaperone
MYKKIFILLIFIIGFNITLQAQEDTSMTDSRKLRKAVKEKFMQKLDIDEATANKFFNLYNEQRKEMKEYNKSKMQLMRAIEDNPDASDVISKINQIIEIDDKINKSRKDFIAELQKFLTSKQIAQSIIFQKNLKKLFGKGKREKND